MKNQKKILKGFCSACIALIMMLNVLSSVAMAIQEQNVDQNPTSSGFMALSKYATATQIPNVYELTLTVEPALSKSAPIYISTGLPNLTPVDTVDVWDSRTQTWISRATAVGQSTQALVDTLIASGKQDIYLSTFMYYGGMSAGSGFKPLYDATGTVDPGFSDLLDSGYLRGYDTWQSWTRWGANSNYVGKGLATAYYDFDRENVPSNARRYFLFYSIGADQDLRYGASQYAAALKAPLDESVAHMNLPYLFLPSTIMGKNTTIWSVSVGNETTVNPNWANDWLSTSVNATPGDFAAWEAGEPNLIQGASPSSMAEPMMISFSIKPPQNTSYTTFPIHQGFGRVGHNQEVHDFYKSALGNPTSLSNGVNANYYFSMNMQENNTNYSLGSMTPAGTRYIPNGQGSVPILDTYKDFAHIALDSIVNVDIVDIIGKDFELYQMKDTDMLSISTDDPDSNINMQVGYSGNKISWTFDKLNSDGYRYTLKYYLKYIGAESENELWHETNQDAYISYDEYKNSAKKTVIKNFPKPYVQPSSNQTKNESNNTNSANGNTDIINGNANDVMNANTGGWIDSQKDDNAANASNNNIIGVFPIFDDPMPIYYSSNKEIETIHDKVVIYQKTTSGKYKAAATAKKGKVFTVLSEEDDYYKIIYQMKDAKAASTGYIKKSDAKILTTSMSIAQQ